MIIIFFKILIVTALIVSGATSCKEAPTVTDVAVNPATVTVTKGFQQSFTATVTGTNDPAQTVTWSIVEANKNAATTIDSEGMLTISAVESLKLLMVRASSTLDKTKSGRSTVTIIDVAEPDPEPDPDPLSKNALQYFKDEGLMAGWNLGNTLDAVNTWSSPGNPFSEETAWGNPKATQALFDGVKSQGFNIVRIPVTWIGHIGPAPGYLVDETRLSRVAEVVSYANNAGLKAIINIHHDDSNEFGWLLIKEASNNTSANAQITAKFEKLWTQIAEYFKDYGEWLMFESMNEIHDGEWGWSSDFRNNPQKQFAILNNWNQVFTNAIRATGGKNERRYLIIPSYVTNPEQTLSERFILPKDKFSGKLVVTFHYYDPFDFAHGNTPNWGSQLEKDAVDNLFERFKKKFFDNNIPVIIGETGPINHNTETGKQSRIAYITHVYGKAREKGIVPVYWDDGGNFGMINRNTGQPEDEHSAASCKAMIQTTK